MSRQGRRRRRNPSPRRTHISATRQSPRSPHDRGSNTPWQQGYRSNEQRNPYTQRRTSSLWVPRPRCCNASDCLPDRAPILRKRYHRTNLGCMGSREESIYTPPKEAWVPARLSRAHSVRADARGFLPLILTTLENPLCWLPSARWAPERTWERSGGCSVVLCTGVLGEKERTTRTYGGVVRRVVTLTSRVLYTAWSILRSCESPRCSCRVPRARLV